MSMTAEEWHKLADERAAEIVKLRKALEPFAQFADSEPGRRDDEVWYGRYGATKRVVTYGDLRRADAALRPLRLFPGSAAVDTCNWPKI